MTHPGLDDVTEDLATAAAGADVRGRDRDVVIEVENVSKLYRLGSINHGTLRADLTSWWARVRGKEDPNRRMQQFAAPGTPVGVDGDEFLALRDVSFDVRRGQVLGIIGKNGAGKSTLLKILSRVTAPTTGEIRIQGRVASLLEVGTGFHRELTGRENIFLNGAILGMNKAEIRKKFDEIVAFAGVETFIDTPVKRYSSGMYVRLAFAVAAHLEPEILIVDEVLAVGDAEFQTKCLGKMSDVAKAGRTVLFVSHNMIAIERLCPNALLLRSGRVWTSGPSRDVVSEYLAAGESHDTRECHRDGYLYARDELGEGESYSVTGLQALDPLGNALTSFGTWDPVTIRIHYEARRPLARGSVELWVSTPEGATMILTSTSPDRTLPMRIEGGPGYADCMFEHWPLAAGVYFLGAALAIPGVEYVCRDENLCSVPVTKRDIYGSGLAPSADRYYVASRHSWRLQDPLEGIPGESR